MNSAARSENGKARIPVSVVIPAYNIAHTLEETLDSIFEQTVAVLEIIVVNDGSSDRTLDVARARGVTVLDVPNRGVSAARNIGVRQAAGDWIAFIDGDDLWALDKLERQWAATLADPESAVVFTDFWQFNTHGCLNRSVVHEVHRGFLAVQGSPIGDNVWRCDGVGLSVLLPLEFPMMPSTLLIRKDVLLSSGGFDEGLTFCEDLELTLRLLARTSVLFVDIPLMGYRRHDSNASTNLLRMRRGNIEVLDRVLSDPLRYCESTVAWYGRHRAIILYKGGRMAVAYGDRRLGRRWLRESLVARKHPAPLAWLLISFLTNNAAIQRLLALAMRLRFSRGVRTTVPLGPRKKAVA